MTVVFESGEEVVFDHLYGDRRGILLRCVGREVRQRRLYQVVDVHVVVIEELFVFYY